VIDLSLSAVARGKIMVAARDGKPIPRAGRSTSDGKPTTDAQAALEGSMLPAGGVKGAMLALTVELLVCALSGAAFGFESDSFFTEEGPPTRIGQAFLAIDPARSPAATSISSASRRWSRRCWRTPACACRASAAANRERARAKGSQCPRPAREDPRARRGEPA
jgi:LDH2 family malate/lactate/ureidoglycolate dehydrogenase